MLPLILNFLSRSIIFKNSNILINNQVDHNEEYLEPQNTYNVINLNKNYNDDVEISQTKNICTNNANQAYSNEINNIKFDNNIN